MRGCRGACRRECILTRSHTAGAGGCREHAAPRRAVARELLAVADNLQRTVAAAERHSPETVEDTALLEGVRRTYIGALPGNIIQAIRKAGSRNCVMMLDEIDKVGAGIQGDPGAALLEVLDPEQNHTFRDNYLGVPFDISRVAFITTANILDTIPGPLRDRMEIIGLAGYTANEKFEIARRYLVPRQMEANGVQPGQVEIAEEALHDIIQHYTREARVRNLEREIGKTLRHAAVRIAEGQTGPIQIGRENLADILGAPQFESELE